MRMRLVSAAVAVLLVSTSVGTLVAQKAAPAPPVPKKNPLLKLVEPWPSDDVMQARRVESDARPLFKDTEPLTFTLTADFNAVNHERKPNNKKVFPAVITGPDGEGAAGHSGEDRIARPLPPDAAQLRVRADCIWRSRATARRWARVFEGQTSLKLGTHCRAITSYEQLHAERVLTYRLFNLVTPLSFRARLARATYVDAKTKKTVSNRYAIFIEHENDVARRFGGRIVELNRIQFTDLDAPTLNR